jgi:hypothetical protein
MPEARPIPQTIAMVKEHSRPMRVREKIEVREVCSG